MITCTMLCGECALISDRHVQSSSCWGVQYITFSSSCWGVQYITQITMWAGDQKLRYDLVWP